MAITTYAELKAAAATWLVRADLTARIPEFIALAEARLNRLLRHRAAEDTHVTSLNAGERRVALPAGFGEAMRVWVGDADGEAEEALFTEASLLTVAAGPGRPRRWTLDGGDLAFDRPAERSYDVTLRYRRRYALSDATPTNALLSEAPDAYLFAVLAEAGPFLRDAEVAGTYEAKLERAIAELNSRDGRSLRLQRLTTELPDLIAGGETRARADT